MDGSFSSYHNGTQHREQDFQKLAQTIGTSIQKIFQNGTIQTISSKCIVIFTIVCSILNAAHGQSNRHTPR